MEKQKQLENLGVTFTPLNSLQVEIQFPNKNFQLKLEKDIIISIEYEGVLLYIDDIIKIPLTTTHGSFVMNYKIAVIKTIDSDNNKVYVLENTYNKASIFALPLLFKEKESASYLCMKKNTFFGYLVNCYVDCLSVEKKDKYSIFLLLKFSKSSRYKEQEDFFINHKQFIKHVDNTKDYVIYEFTIQNAYKLDYKLLIDGKYSKISQEAKDRILNFHGNKTNEGKLAYNVLNKTKELASKLSKSLKMDIGNMDIELFSKFNEEDVL